MKDNVIFAGFRRDIPEILGTTDIFAVSSFSEGLPTSLLEAMAAGKSSVVTDIGLPVNHMETGLVVASKSVMSLRNAIEALIHDRRLRKRLGENSADFVRKNCTQRMAAEKHMEMFRRIIGDA